MKGSASTKTWGRGGFTGLFMVVLLFARASADRSDRAAIGVFTGNRLIEPCPSFWARLDQNHGGRGATCALRRCPFCRRPARDHVPRAVEPTDRTVSHGYWAP